MKIMMISFYLFYAAYKKKNVVNLINNLFQKNNAFIMYIKISFIYRFK